MLWGTITGSLFPVLPSLLTCMPGELSQCSASYQAPMRFWGAPEEIYSEAYTVYLFPGHSLQQHFEAIYEDLKPYNLGVLDAIYLDKVVYVVQKVNDEMLAAIRSDPGVEFVDYDYMAYADEAVEEEPSLTDIRDNLQSWTDGVLNGRFDRREV